MERRSFADDKLRHYDSKLFSRMAVRVSANGLAGREDFALDNVLIRPSLRTIAGPGGDVMVEPRVMEVLLALTDSHGRVLTRADLIDGCWAGQTVGDDSINRAISENRRALRKAGAAFTIETVPKIGYRIAVAAAPQAIAAKPPRSLSRRALFVAAGGAAVTTAVAVGLRLSRKQPDRRVAELLDRGQEALRSEATNSTEEGIGFFREAIRLDPEDAKAWGLLALALRNAAEYAPRSDIATAVSACQAAARRANMFEPDQAEAEAALALLPPIYGDWLRCEASLRKVLARHPNQVDLLSGLGMLFFSVGRVRAAATCSERAASLYPLSPIFQYRRAYHLWTLGQIGDADRMIDRAMQLWPTNASVWYARMLIFAGSGRPGAALRMLHDTDAPPAMPPSVNRAWRTTLDTLEQGTSGGRVKVVADQLAAARESGIGCINALLGLSLIGALDEAFVVADGFLLAQGPLITRPGSTRTLISDQRWRKTMMLFTPATAPLRADPRFIRLCDNMGLTEYWRKAGIRPDFSITELRTTT